MVAGCGHVDDVGASISSANIHLRHSSLYIGLDVDAAVAQERAADRAGAGSGSSRGEGAGRCRRSAVSSHLRSVMCRMRSLVSAAPAYMERDSAGIATGSGRKMVGTVAGKGPETQGKTRYGKTPHPDRRPSHREGLRLSPGAERAAADQPALRTRIRQRSGPSSR